MIALIWLPTRVVFILMLLAALFLGSIGGTWHLDIPLWLALLASAGVSWLAVAAVDFREGRGIEPRTRIAYSANAGVGGLFILYPSLLVLCAPAYFLLTGAFWPSVIPGLIGLGVSWIITPPPL